MRRFSDLPNSGASMVVGDAVVRVDGAPPPLPFQLELWGEDRIRQLELFGRTVLGHVRA